MAPENHPRNREHLVPPGSYMYVQDGTSGKIKTNVGPIQVSLTGNDSPMVYERHEFKRLENLEQAVRKSIVVPDGYYVVLMNPAVNPRGEIVHPNEGNQSNAMPELSVGNKVVIEGPVMFALWPGQAAEVTRSHHLRSNQYLVVRVYNEEEARKNWGSARMVGGSVKPPSEGTGTEDPTKEGSDNKGQPVTATSLITPDQLTVGKLLIIKGTEVSFYIPPTGITVEKMDGVYVREAVTLEQLEYCVLLGEDGNKRYVHGPDVVFPEPTEIFMTTQEVDGAGNKYVANKYRAMELNEIQGLHIKVTHSHEDPMLGLLKEGQEVFFTGKNYPIYFPRQEHVIVRYDGKSKHFAVVVPKGDARYVMDRMTGEIALTHGPTMLLPNPVKEIIVRRALTDRECELYYPGNAEVLEYNRVLRELAKTSPTTRQGVVSEGEIERASRRKDNAGAALRKATSGLQADAYAANIMSAQPQVASRSMADNSNVSMSNFTGLVDEISRASTYNAPRTLTLNTKYEGALKIQPFNNYAVMVTDSKGSRRVEEGPAHILLQYDEVLESLSLSTGKPKTTDKLLLTSYLRVRNNNIADIVAVETSDHVTMNLKVVYLVNFMGSTAEQKQRWFAIENYVKFLCDHMRSLLKAAAKQVTIAELYANPLPFVRKIVLKDEKEGTLFEENNMEVTDVELLDASIPDNDISGILRTTQKQTVTRNIMLEEKRRNLQATIEGETLLVKELEVKNHTEMLKKRLDVEMVGAELGLALARYDGAMKANAEKARVAASEETLSDIHADAELAREKRTREQAAFLAEQEQDVQITLLKANAEALVSKFVALQGGFSESLLALSSQEAMAKIAQALSVQQLVGGQDVVEVVTRLFEGTGLGKMLEKLVKRSDTVVLNGNGGGKSLPEASPAK